MKNQTINPPSQSEVGEVPTPIMLNKNDIIIECGEKGYQRDPEERQRWVNKTIRSFNWKYFGAISVALRDGKYYCVDGGGRLEVVKSIPYIYMIPCSVFKSKNKKDEAKSFYIQDRESIKINSNDYFKACLVAKDPVAIEVYKLIQSSGRKMVKSYMGTEVISCQGTLLKIAREDLIVLKRIWPICIQIMCGSNFYSDLVRAIFYIEKHISNGTVTSPLHVKKLITLTPENLRRTMLNGVVTYGKGGTASWARGLVDWLNKGKRTNKIKLSEKVVR